MPDNPIHVLYNGNQDSSFRAWLNSRKVTLHQHEPHWKDKIEEMRQNGDTKVSHLFSHPGNYFGTWQRIDIPLFLDDEYVLLLDADTIIRKQFALADLGNELTESIAMSSEINLGDKQPSNAGVTLMKLETLRKTHSDFMGFIMKHVKKGGKFNHPSPSDQGAYMVFYKNSVAFLDEKFNVKPYWSFPIPDFQNSYILHFHGPKPNDYIRFIMNEKCGPAIDFLCERGFHSSPYILCQSLAVFARASLSVDKHAFCTLSFANHTQASFCQSLMEQLSGSHEPQCGNFEALIQKSWEGANTDTSLLRLREVEDLMLHMEQEGFLRNARFLVFFILGSVSFFYTWKYCSRKSHKKRIR